MNDFKDLPDDIPINEGTAPSDNEVKSVVALAREQWLCERDVRRLKEELAAAEERLKNVAERELPNLMVEVGLTSLSLTNGAKLELETRVFASITQENLVAAHDWLESNDHADLIKREFKINFNKEDEAWAQKFKRDCARRKRPLNLSEKRAVHPQTLNKWVREMLDEGYVIPEDVFGVYKKRTTKIIPPKKPLEETI